MENELLLETFSYGIGYGISYFFTMGILISIFDLIYENKKKKNWRRKSFIKHLDNEDIEMINYILSSSYAKSINCQKEEIGNIIVNAYEKDIKLKKIRKEQWDKLKFWKKGE